MSKPLPALGLVIGVIACYVAILCAQYSTTKLLLRMQMYRTDPDQLLPGLGILLVVAVVLGVLMMVPSIGAGVTTGAGALLAVVGLAALVLPMRQAFDFGRLFQFPGSRYGGYLLFDGSFLLFGIPLLLVGIRRWAQEAKMFKLLQGPQQPQQWGGYPGQQPLPPQPQYPQQPPQYPGQPPRQ
ncbi:hypothetical protein ACQHIV_37120 [Kribbella sp. GL6]|uniref:hypothetical protein n=1 Tax=Kribbella sp. GL6 TaxID=3419765 RepID=UPI003D00666B